MYKEGFVHGINTSIVLEIQISAQLRSFLRAVSSGEKKATPSHFVELPKRMGDMRVLSRVRSTIPSKLQECTDLRGFQPEALHRNICILLTFVEE